MSAAMVRLDECLSVRDGAGPFRSFARITRNRPLWNESLYNGVSFGPILNLHHKSHESHQPLTYQESS